MSGLPAGAGQLLGQRLGKFEILALLALGGTAEIYLARIGGTAGFEKYVVVKCLHDHLADDAEFVKMFLDEARLAAHLDHSNIVQTMELGEHDGRYYMGMEFLAGLSLAMIVRRAAERLPSARIPVPLVLNILAQSSAGLHYAHEKAANGKALNIVHRDISPQNLVISFEGVVKLVDFGIAKAETRETRTRSGTIKGKFAYMSPEQCVANHVDRRTDVFALGVIGHELLTGQRLFKRPSPYETYQAVLECDVKPPSAIDPAIDPALDPVIMRAIAKDKSERYPTAEAFGDAVLGYLHRRGIGSGPSDLSRFFDAHFSQELEEHSVRMRELIAGRNVQVDTGASWRIAGEDDRQGAGEPADRRARPGDELAAHGSSADVLPGFDDLGGASRGEADDDLPAEPTRIESNPLERIHELERLAGRSPGASSERAAPGAQGAHAGGAARFAPPSAERAPAPPPPGIAGAASAANGPRPASLPGMPPSGRFPDPAALPTVIAAAELGTQVAPPPSPAASPRLDGAATPPQDVALALGHPHARVQSDPHPQGDPVMNAELHAQVAIGATVFPSELPRGSAPYPAPRIPAPDPVGPRGSQPPEGYLQASPLYRMPNGQPADVQRTAGVRSPVGQHDPGGVDRDRAAASRVRVVPPWLLAVLFVGAVGVALALTVMIARLIAG